MDNNSLAVVVHDVYIYLYICIYFTGGIVYDIKNKIILESKKDIAVMIRCPSLLFDSNFDTHITTDKGGIILMQEVYFRNVNVVDVKKKR